MKDIKNGKFIFAGVSGLLLAALSLGVAAQTTSQGNAAQPAGTIAGAAPSTGAPAAMTGTTGQGQVQAKGEDKQDAATHIAKATQAVKKMEQDPQLRKLLQQAKGVFIIPDYGRAALGIGAQGGAGMLVTHQGGKWSSPGFYNFGGVSIGAQAGISAGQVAMLLMTDKALQSFATNNKFALNADAGITIIAWPKRATGSAGHGDVVMWSDAKGAFADLNVGASDVNFDEEETRAFYGKPVTAQDIASGKVTTTKAQNLISALSTKWDGPALSSGSKPRA